MGNRTSTGKVILSNGMVQEFHEPLTVAELMLEHPHHVMVEVVNKSLASLKSRPRKPSPLSADTWLNTKNVYLMVPMRKGNVRTDVTVSSKEVHRLVARADNSSLMKKLKVFTSFPKAILPYISVNGKMCTFMRKDCVEECLLKRTRCQSETKIWEEMPENYSWKVSRRGWRPSLDTITEKNVEKKVAHWLY